MFQHPPPAIECVTMLRVCRRYRTVPLEAFVKGHLRVVWRATTKLFDGWYSWVPSKHDFCVLCKNRLNLLFYSIKGHHFGYKFH